MNVPQLKDLAWNNVELSDSGTSSTRSSSVLNSITNIESSCVKTTESRSTPADDGGGGSGSGERMSHMAISRHETTSSKMSSTLEYCDSASTSSAPSGRLSRLTAAEMLVCSSSPLTSWTRRVVSS